MHSQRSACLPWYQVDTWDFLRRTWKVTGHCQWEIYYSIWTNVGCYQTRCWWHFVFQQDSAFGIIKCVLPCHLFPMFMLPCASVVYMQYAFDRLCFLTRCESLFPLFFSIYCFVAAIYANKDVYKVLESDLWSLNFFNCCLPLNSQQWTSLIVRFRQPHIRTSITHESTILKQSSSDWLKSREVVNSIWVKRCFFFVFVCCARYSRDTNWVRWENKLSFDCLICD